MIVLLVVLTGVLLGFTQELTLKRVIEDTLKNNLELQASLDQVKALEKEYESAKGLLFPNLKFEEIFTRTDIPAYVLFTKLNQERITPADFTPNNLNDPKAVSNFETKLSLEVPIWMGGKIRSFKRIAFLRLRAEKENFKRTEEKVIFQAYETFLKASLAMSAIKVAQKNFEDAKEHLRIAQKSYETGTALFSDVLKAKVFVSKAKEKLTEAENNYLTALKALSLLANTNYEGLSVRPLESCPSLNLEELKAKALENREDLKAVQEFKKIMKESYRASLGDLFPQVAGFVSYSLYDKDVPFGSDGKGYMFGLSLSLNFNTGLSQLKKAESFKLKERALEKRENLLRKAILFEVERAFLDYKTALASLKSAEDRIRSAEEAVRILKVRYENGMARMVDLLDAQAQLEIARFDYAQALYRCNLAYGKALFEAGVIKEVLR